MLRSCKYCMRVHDTKIDCGRKPPPRYYKRENDKDKFRQSMPWRHKREEIRIRDKQLCQVCIRNLYDTLDQYTYNDISVHHAISLEDDYNRRLDNDNLITICSYHHQMAEAGKIPYKEIKKIIDEQENDCS